MIKQKCFNTFFINLGLILFFILHWSIFPVKSSSKAISYQTYQQPHSIVHVITIPHQSNYELIPTATDKLATLKKFVLQNKAIAGINGGFFDPKNQQTTSYILQKGNVLADPRNNIGLIKNRNIQPYLGKILNRSEFRSYICGKDIQYDIALHSDPIPLGCQLQDALGAGPKILPLETSIQEGFIAFKNGKLVRNAIGTTSRNARSAIAIAKNQDILLIMVEQRSHENSGMSLAELANFLSELGVVKAMNLDGGSSSAISYQGQIIYGRLNSEGNQVKRPLKSVLLVTEKDK
ncbi:MAG: phosphodiester glycosidase family protein [Xenococcus sp. (in: cyanobacteria)]